MSKNDNNLIWLDMEMSGLDVERDKILGDRSSRN
jgi:oligoribonuclease (3'-5' exoribonuclease)